MCIAGKIVAYFSDHCHLSESTNGWLTTDCPFCGKKQKFCINPEYDIVKCWVCEYHSDTVNFIRKTENLTVRQAHEKIYNYKTVSYKATQPKARNFNSLNDFNVTSSFKFPYGYKPLLEGDGFIANKARSYLANRGFSLEYLANLGFGYCDERNEDFKLNYEGYIILPFKRNGLYYYFNARDFMNQGLRYKNPSTVDFKLGKSELLWNEDALYYDKVWIMEGVFSALTIGDQAIATMGKAVSKEQISKILRSPCKEVVIAFDPGCHKETYALAKELIRYKDIKALKLVDGDPNDLGAEHLLTLEQETDYLNNRSLIQLLK